MPSRRAEFDAQVAEEVPCDTPVLVYPEWDREHSGRYITGATFDGGRTEMREKTEAKLREMLDAYNSVDRESQADYNHSLFYGDVNSAEY